MDVFLSVKRNPLVLALGCVAAVAIVAISEGSYRRSVAVLDKLGTVATARTSLQSLTQGLADAETGQRGYLLTGRPEYLQPYARARQKITDALGYLDVYYATDRVAGPTLAQLHRLAEAKLGELAETIRVQNEGRPEQARELVLSGLGRESMDAIRSLGTQLLADETQRVTEGRTAVYATLMTSRIGVALLTALGLLALATYLRQSARLVKQQREQQRLVQAERDHLEEEVARRTELLTALAQHLQTAREDERHRLARNLHDELGALLTSAKLDAARIKSRLGGSAPEASERLAHLVETLNSSIALGRRIIEDLRPSTLTNLGLVAALDILGREFAEASGLTVHRHLQPVGLSPSAELTVYRLVQEAITNISKYAQAHTVWLELGPQEGQVQVSVRDDGLGFNAGTQRHSAYGLVGMRFRVEAERGTLRIESAPGQGTRIQALLPAPA
ncbi:signal transduction histidine kinase [Burkholderiales bacterium JOSHI_001]|nr:signal transduction histidine kinase [Burkholderiales bacterium JOSHI_001]